MILAWNELGRNGGTTMDDKAIVVSPRGFLFLEDLDGGPVTIRRRAVLAVWPSLSERGGAAVKYGSGNDDLLTVKEPAQAVRDALVRP